MTSPSSLLRKSLSFAVLLTLGPLLLPQTAQAGDKEFGVLVHYVESHYQVHRQYRFILGFASFAVNVVRPYGVKGMKLAIWDQQTSSQNKDDQDFTNVVKSGLAEGWQPMVRVWSRRDGERTMVFAKPDGKDMKLLVATVDNEDAVVVQVKINPDKLSKCIDQWSHNDRRDHHNDQLDRLPPNSNRPEADESHTLEGM